MGERERERDREIEKERERWGNEGQVGADRGRDFGKRKYTRDRVQEIIQK